MTVSINTYGGPVLVLNQAGVSRWGGSFSKGFIKNGVLPTDYEVVCQMSQEGGPRNIFLFEDGSDRAMVLCLPYETTIVSAEKNCVRLAQCAFGPEEWPSNDTMSRLFDAARFGERYTFTSARVDRYFMFDAACILGDGGVESLSFSLEPGAHIFESAMADLGDEASFILAQIRKA